MSMYECGHAGAQGGCAWVQVGVRVSGVVRCGGVGGKGYMLQCIMVKINNRLLSCVWI